MVLKKTPKHLKANAVILMNFSRLSSRKWIRRKTPATGETKVTFCFLSKSSTHLCLLCASEAGSQHVHHIVAERETH